MQNPLLFRCTPEVFDAEPAGGSVSAMIMYRPMVFIVLGLAALFSGCMSSSQMSRIDANRTLYESWPLDMQQAVLDGKVVPGMTPDMVRMAIGKPTEVTTRSNGGPGDEVWIYRKGGDDGGGLGGLGGMGGPNIGLGGSLGGIGINTASGMGTSIGTGIGTAIGPNVGIGTSIGTNIGAGLPAPSSSGPAEERDVVFQDGVVLRADAEP